MRRWWWIAIAGCGRFEFAAQPDAPPVADAVADGAPDGAMVMIDAAPVAPCTVAACPTGYSIISGGCYRLGTPLGWVAAEQSCETVGAHLVVEDSVAEHSTVHSIAAGFGQVWIGWTDRRGPDNVFSWVAPDAGGLLQSNGCVFGAGEPDAGDADHCAAQNATDACGDYQDLDCAMSVPYVCECDGNPGDPTKY